MFQPQTPPVRIGMMLFPSFSELEFMAPYGIFSHLPNTQIYRLAPTLDPVYSDSGFPLVPNTSFEKAPDLDVLFVPGGLGVTAKLEDAEFLRFLRVQGERARYITSIGSGSLLLGAAGLLKGYRATTDWFSLELLKLLGVEPVSERIVVDCNRITGSSILDGLALGNAIATELFGSAIVQETQLRLDYNPSQLTDDCLESVSSEVLARVRAEQHTLSRARLQIIRRSPSIVQNIVQK
ncbi:DJ-1/PfpI family protein [Phormidesmis sp. 146-33]